MGAQDKVVVITGASSGIGTPNRVSDWQGKTET